MILLRKITLKNFLSHENTIIEFNEDEKTLLDGASGAGKSSIFDAILWALYGQSRTDNRNLVRKGAKRGSVSLELKREVDGLGDVVILTRGITGEGKHTLEATIQSADGSKTVYPLSGLRELQNWIDKELIGASYLLFINSVAYVQGNSESFVSQTAPKRKELLLEIIKAEDYHKYYETARQTLTTFKNDENLIQGQIIALETQSNILEGRTSKKEEYIKEIEDCNKQLRKLTPNKNELESKKASYVGVNKAIEVLANSIENTTKDLAPLAEKMLTSMSRVSSDKKNLLLAKVNELTDVNHRYLKEKESLDNARKILSDASSQEAIRNEFMAKKPIIHDSNFVEIDRLKNRIEDINTKPVCPSGVDCPYSGDHTGQIEAYNTQIKELEISAESESVALSEWCVEEKKLPAQLDIRSLVANINSIEIKIKSIENELNTIKACQEELDSLAAIEAEIPRIQEEIDIKKSYINDLTKQKTDFETTPSQFEKEMVIKMLLEIIEEEKLLNEKTARAYAMVESIVRDEIESAEIKDKINAHTQEVKIIKEKSRKLEMVKDAFSSKGIETLVIDWILPKLEDRINDVLSKLSDFRVRLDTQRKSADGENIIEGLFITIINTSGEELSFENYSGGEKLKISVSISEALATLQKVGFRLFDEVFIGLDDNSTESFAEVLQGLQKNFNQVLCISHLLQIKDLFDKRINIVKNNNISYAKL